MGGNKSGKLVAYYRVSTRRQGESGLGLEAQKEAVASYAAGIGADVVAAYTEVESGKRHDRPELEAALARARRTGATLCIAKLDRLARNVAFLSGLMDGGVDFVCCDNPHATRLTVHILAAVAEDEARRISERTRAALQAFKAGQRVSRRVREQYPQGVPQRVVRERAGRLGAALPECRNLSLEAAQRGREQGAAAVRSKAAAWAVDMAAVVRDAAAGKSLREAAAELNEAGYLTRRGKPWSAMAVARVLSRAEWNR